MVAEPQTIRVPRTVEKRIPVTYTYNVSRLVCYRVPLDACGQPITGPALEMGGPAAPALAPVPDAVIVPGAVPGPRQPTPARRPDGANVKPEIGSDAAAPKPIESEENPSVREPGPMKDISPKGNSSPYPSPKGT